MHKYFSNLFHELKSFFAHEAGSVVIISAIVLPVLLGVSGMSLDYIRAYSLRTTLQGAIDSAVLAGVTSSQDEEQQIIAAMHNKVSKSRSTTCSWPMMDWLIRRFSSRIIS